MNYKYKVFMPKTKGKSFKKDEKGSGRKLLQITCFADEKKATKL